MENLVKGTKVRFLSYGQEKTGTVSHMSRNGSVVFLEGGRWLHRESVQLAAENMQLSQESSK